MHYERLVEWAHTFYAERHPDVPVLTLWASADCGNNVAHKQVRAGRKLGGKVRYQGHESVPCPVISPVGNFGARSGQTVLLTTGGAWLFRFAPADAPAFEVLYACAFTDDYGREVTAIALVPKPHLDTWAQFESVCARAVRPRMKRRRDMYVIGGQDAFFDPTVVWEDVILPEGLKTRLRDDVDAFFANGVAIYRQLKLAPFRKLLLAGVPGTGKTMLCAALARLSIQAGRVVVYVSGSDRDGASFDKIQRALQTVATARYPTLLVVEEFDAYLRGEDKARILNVLDGIESPSNPRGALMLATTNYPEVIDERIAKRPGRLDRVFIIPSIEDVAQAEGMLRHYMADQWDDSHSAVAASLVNQPGAFVREVALHARMLAAHERRTSVTLEMLRLSVDTLLDQLQSGADFLARRRSMGLVQQPNNGRVEYINPARRPPFHRG